MADTAGTADAPEQWLSEHHSPGYAAPASPPSPAQPSTSGPQAAVATNATFQNAPQWFVDFLTGNPGGGNGPIVNEFTAINYAAVYACVSLIAGTVASLPLKVYRRRPDGGQDEQPTRPEWNRLQVEFNPNTSAMSGREAGLGHLLTWGNSYCQIVRNRLPSRDIIRLQPLGPDIVRPDLNAKGELEYEIYDRQTGKVVATLQRDEMLHVSGFGFDAMCGYSVVQVAKSVIRTGMAQDREAERFVTRGIRPPGAIKMPVGKKFANEQAAMRFRDTFRKLHNTEDGNLSIMILEDGTEWQSLGIDPVSAQLLESRKFTPQEICSIYHVPPHMAGLLEKVTSWGTGIEEMTIGFIVYCLLPILRRVEQEYNRKFFGESGEYFCEHVLSGLLRGDSLKQAQAIQIYVNLGLLSINDARKILGWNPVAGGNIRYYPLSMGRVDDEGSDIPALATADPAGQTRTPPAIPTGTPGQPGQAGQIASAGQQQEYRSLAQDPTKLAGSLRKAIVAAAGRCLRKEAAEAVKAARKPEAFVGWLDTFYAKHREMVEEATRPLLESWAAAFPSVINDVVNAEFDWPAVMARAHVDRSRRELLQAAECKPDELPAAVEKVTQRWAGERLAEIGAEFQPGEVVSG